MQYKTLWVVTSVLLVSQLCFGANWINFDWLKPGGTSAASAVVPLEQPVTNASTQRFSTANFHLFQQSVRELYANLHLIMEAAKATGLDLTDYIQYSEELFTQRILPQLYPRDHLNVTVAGGNNVGKSSVANHVAGRNVTEVSPIAGKTKHSILITSSHYSRKSVENMHPDIPIVEHGVASDSSREGEHQIVWHQVSGASDRLWLYDQPDFDGRAENEVRARRTSQVVDVVVAVISKDKYGVEEGQKFFSQMYQEGKGIILVLNQITDEERELGDWKVYLEEFTKRTGIKPIATFVVPHSVAASRNGSMQFFRVNVPASGYSNATLAPKAETLRDYINGLNVDQLRARAESGAIEAALRGTPERPFGALQLLEAVRQRSDDFRDFHAKLRQVDKQKWTPVPGKLMVDSIGRWFHEKKRWQVARVSLEVVGMAQYLLRRAARLATAEPSNTTEDWIVKFREDEEKTVDKLVRERAEFIQNYTSGGVRLFSNEQLNLLQVGALDAVKAEAKKGLSKGTLKEDFAKTVSSAIDVWDKEHPIVSETLRYVDLVGSGIVLPAVSVASMGTALIFSTGGVPTMDFGTIAANMAKNFGTNLLTQVGGTAASGGVSAHATRVAGESATTQILPVLFMGVATAYSNVMVNKVNKVLKQHLRPLRVQLVRGAMMDRNPAFKSADACIAEMLAWCDSCKLP